MTRRVKYLFIASLAISMGLNACGSKTSSTASSSDSSSTTASAGTKPAANTPDKFSKTPEDIAARTPGELLDQESVPTLLGGKAYRILYVSSDQQDQPIAVTGLALIPRGTAPEEGWPVVSWAHPTVGLADSCAPSAEPLITLTALAASTSTLDAVVVATDYQGLGTEGKHPYLVGNLAARNTLDAIAAVGSLTKTANNSVVLGYSQGGQAALFAAQIAPVYTPDLNVVGVAAVAPPTDMQSLLEQDSAANQGTGLIVAGIYGASVVNESLDTAKLLTPSAYENLNAFETTCADDFDALFPGGTDANLAPDFATDPELRKTVADSSANPSALTMPLYIAQGDSDELVLPALTNTYVDAACKAGKTVTYQVVEGADHGSVFVPATRPTITWLADRLSGKPATSTC